MIDPTRGSIPIPNLDDRSWQDLVDEVKALIPTYAPQWTDTSASDLGITLIELFAWLVEGLTYRLNRVPEKNYIAFLNLLGITREPAVPAHVFLTFRAQPSATGSVLVPQKTQAQTQGSETQAPIIFETDTDLSVLPTNLKAVLFIPGDPNDPNHPAGKYENITPALAVPPAQGSTLVAPGPSQTQAAPSIYLCLGFDSQVTVPLPLGIRLFKPVGPIAGTNPPQGQATIKFTYSTATATDPTAWLPLPASNVIDNTNGLQQEGSIIITPPADWTSQAPTSSGSQTPPLPQWTTPPASTADTVTDALFWIGMTITNQTPVAAPSPVQIGVSPLRWNSVSAYNALTITNPEQLGQSDGTSFQVFSLQHVPLFKRPDTDSPYDHLQIQVGSDIWQQADDLPAGAGNFYRLNPVTGTISFGNFDPKKNEPGTYGTIPPQGTAITALAYRYVVGGLSGNVGAGKITNLVSVRGVNGIASVLNAMSSFDAADEETIKDTMRRAPDQLKSHDRAVTVEDYETLAFEATPEVAIARCLPPHLQGFSEPNPGQPWTFANINRAPGNSNVIIVPNQGPDVLYPYPSTDLVRKVQSYLDTRRDLAVSLLVSGPYYLPIIATATIMVWSTAINQGLATIASVQADTDKKLRTYLHPVIGGLDGRGWQVGQSVFMADLFKAIMPPENIGFISSLTLSPDTPLYQPPARPSLPSGTWVSLADYELVCYSPQNRNSITVQRQL